MPARVENRGIARSAVSGSAWFDALVHDDSGIGSLNGMLGTDVSGFDPDGPLPDIPETNASKSGGARTIEKARREDLTIRELSPRAGSYTNRQKF